MIPEVLAHDPRDRSLPAGTRDAPGQPHPGEPYGLRNLRRGDPVVHDAEPFPREDRLLREPLDLPPEVPVRDKDDLILFHRVDHLHRV